MAGKPGILIKIYGIVQGVGFRPFAARLAKKYNISGHVKNRGGYVEVLAAAAVEDGSLRLFLHDLCTYVPPGSAVIHTEEEEFAVDCEGFKILESMPDESSPVMLPPDLAPCPDCVRELYNSENRRYMHPFISCTACGARYSIIDSVPYDRITTTQSEFPLCPDCAKEYISPDDRRLCAQTVCCNSCGPRVYFGDKTGTDAISAAAEKIEGGGIIAVKGVGGYHLACSPFDGNALSRLRNGKKREEKPFAVMFPNYETLCEYCVSDEKSLALLESSARPIVLLHHGNKSLHPSVCMGSGYVGAFLPSAPHQMLLCDICGPIVMTSGNISGAPIAISKDALVGLDIDGVLDHDRKINTPLDDSVILPMDDGHSFIRRSRGYVPLPIHVKSKADATFAAGGDLKACFGLRRENWCYLSQHLGDLEDIENQRLYMSQISHMTRLFNINPCRAVCDLHPGYYSSEMARTLELPIIQIQHHYAHILSAMAENGFEGECIGIALDGTGFGEDNNIWGFEFLKCSASGFTRLGHLKYTSMPASDSSMRNAKRAAMCSLMGTPLAEVFFPENSEIKIMQAARDADINTVFTSSAGRLFDSVAYLLGCGDFNHFEGQCAQALECLAKSGSKNFEMSFSLCDTADGFVLDPMPVFEAIITGKASPSDKAYGFHQAIARGICDGACRIRDMYSVSTVALGGGVFQNVLLSRLVSAMLAENGFRVIRNHDYPCGDGGLALGQLCFSPDC